MRLWAFLPSLLSAACAGHAAERASGGTLAAPVAVVTAPAVRAAGTVGPAPAAPASDPRAPVVSSPGSLSLGVPNHGRLWNGVQMPDGPFWEVVDPKHSFGTEEAIASLVQAIQAVNAEFPDSPRLYVGQLSAEHGGYLRPHRSHQNGRDVDLGYYYRGGPHWYTRANAKTLDLQRTWALVKALAIDPNVEMLFIDRGVQRLLHAHAVKLQEDAAWLATLFGATLHENTLIRHEWGHTTHIHVRFRCERSRDQQLASR